MQKKFDKTRFKRLAAVVAMSFISMCMYAQTQVSGTVKDGAGEPVIGASVVAQGSTVAVITDVDGRYTINVPAGSNALTFSFLGMKTVTVPITGSVVDVTLESDTKVLDEVVFIGYGTVKKRDVTGSVSSVSAKDIAKIPVATAAEAIIGKMAGVQVVATDGSPDAEIIIRVRGGGSITGDNSPLYIVDGFPVNSISDVAPNDIASVDVLKDASSTAIYGARGANGVVIITTKSGQEGKITVSYNAYYGVKKIAKTLGVLNPYEYALWQYERSLLAGDEKEYTKFFGNWDDINLYRDVAGNDWQDITFGRTGHTFNQNLTINGGSDKFKYAFSYNHIDEKAIMEGSSYSRDNLMLKLSNQPHKRVKIDFSARWAQTNVNGSGVNDGGQERGSTTDARLRYSIIYPTLPISGDLADPSNTDQGFNLYSPLVSLRDNDRIGLQRNLNLNGSVAWEFLDNLTLKTEVGLDQVNTNNDRFYGITTYYVRNNVPAADQMKPAITFKKGARQSLRNTNTLNIDFKKWLPEDHHLNLLVGQELIFTTNETLTSEIVGFDPSFTFDLARRLSTQGNALSVDNNFSPDDKLFSFFSRVNYDFKSKYLFSATFRADGSSKFSEGNRWGYFPSAAAAWRISEEPFMEISKSWLSDLKLRLSYGTAGNNNIPSGQMAQTYSSSNTTWVNGYNSFWAPSKTMANPDLTWETTVTRNAGLDFGFLGGRLSATAEYYYNTTSDLLILFPISGTGYDNQYRNMGETQNTGFEFTFTGVILEKEKYGLSVSANIGFNKNKINSLGIMEDFMGPTDWASTEIGNEFLVAVGGQVGEMIGYRNDGRYEVSDFNYDPTTGYTLKDGVVDSSPVVGTLRPGSMKLKSLDGDLIVTEDYKDREVIGNANPLHTGGFNISGYAYGFDLSLNFNWSYGNDIYNANKIEYTSTSKYHSRNMIDVMARGERWTNLDLATGELVDDPDQLAAMNANTTLWSPYMKKFVFTDWAVEDGSFLRLNTVTLGYTLPKELTQKFYVQNLRFYATAYNVFVWTNYSGFDPEVSTRRKLAYTPGVDFAAYPRSRAVMFGINLTF
jgi:TonB-linked SusC/RagA family outer membrane protein